MIRVTLAAEPAAFDGNVRQPGLDAISELVGERPGKPRRGRRRPKVADRREDIPPGKFPPFWTKAIDDLLAAYGRICAYVSCYIEPVTGMPTVDHMVPKSRAWNEVYEWSNYRLASLLMNARKNDLTTILDPFEVQDSWFQLELVGFQVNWSGPRNRPARAKVDDTLELLNIRDCRVLRETYATEYWASHIDIDYLTRRMPFVATELRRQNRLRTGDV
jgi:hypothetical protein